MDKDKQRLTQLRALGVRWRKGRLPRYPASMTPEQKAKATVLLDAVSETFYTRQCTKP